MSGEYIPFGELDYFAIEAAIMENIRGRWFLLSLLQHSSREGTIKILHAIEELEKLISRRGTAVKLTREAPTEMLRTEAEMLRTKDASIHLPLDSPNLLTESEYHSIKAALLRTDGGRWFLKHFPQRHMGSDTACILAAIHRLQEIVEISVVDVAASSGPASAPVLKLGDRSAQAAVTRPAAATPHAANLSLQKDEEIVVPSGSDSSSASSTDPVAREKGPAPRSLDAKGARADALIRHERERAHTADRAPSPHMPSFLESEDEALPIEGLRSGSVSRSLAMAGAPSRRFDQAHFPSTT